MYLCLLVNPKKLQMNSFYKSNLLVIALMSLHFIVNAQVKKYVTLEQFTQASCPPCAAENPGFNSSILQGQYKSSIHHVAYHVSWPGYDPMYNANPTDANARINYYAVNGVPELFMQGITWTGSPSTISNSIIYNESVNSSPIGISVKETASGSTRYVTVKVFVFGAVNPGNYYLRTAVIENPINYATPPGSNGEKFFPNVFRKMLPTSAGQALTMPAIGDSLTYNYSYSIQSGWIASNVSCMAFVEDDNTKKILNSGASNDPPFSFIKPKALFTAINKNGCKGKSIQFYDASQNSPKNWFWKFPGGKPATSTLQNPIIQYDSAGTFDVSLRVSGYGNTKDSIKTTGCINIGIPGITSPLPESFEPVSFPPTGWTIINPDKSKTWARNQLAKKTGNASAYINNFNYYNSAGIRAIGQTDDLISPSYNLSSITNPQLYFQLAYTYLSVPNESDTLEVLISDCGENYVSIYKKWGDDLKTAAASGISFVPKDNEWSKQVIDLTSYAGSENAKFIFRQISNGQNNLFLDDIQILNATGVENISKNENKPQIFPNPCSGILRIHSNDKPIESIKIYDLSGQLVFQSNTPNYNENNTVYSLHTLANGIYSADIISGNSHSVQKLIILK